MKQKVKTALNGQSDMVKERGFTLIEIMVVVVILGILGAFSYTPLMLPTISSVYISVVAVSF